MTLFVSGLLFGIIIGVVGMFAIAVMIVVSDRRDE